MIQIDTFKFGTVGVEENKKISFESGLLGFPGLKDFMLIHDDEKGIPSLMYLQSLEDKDVAFTVVNPLAVTDAYSPAVDDKDVEGLAELKEDNVLILVTLTIPEKTEEMTANLQAPIIINTETNKGVQVIAANDDLSVRQPVYEYLKSKKG